MCRSTPSNVSLTVLPSLSSAVIVMIAEPSATAITVNVRFNRKTSATTASDVSVVKVRASPSLNTADRHTSRISPVSRPDTSAMAEATTGAAFTVTVKASSAVPPLL